MAYARIIKSKLSQLVGDSRATLLLRRRSPEYIDLTHAHGDQGTQSHGIEAFTAVSWIQRHNDSTRQ